MRHIPDVSHHPASAAVGAPEATVAEHGRDLGVAPALLAASQWQTDVRH